MGPGPAHLGPGSPQVNAFCGHQGPQAADAFTGRGVRALWDPGPSGHSPFSGSPAQTLESRCVSVHVCRLGAGWGLRSQERLLAPQAGLRPEAPRETGSLGVGPARPGPRPPGAEPGRAPHPGPGSLVLPWHSASAGVGDALASVVHGKRNGPLGGGESFQFHGQDPRDPVKQAGYVQGGARGPEGGSWWGCLPSTCRVPRLGPKGASCGSDKCHLLGASPLFFHP